MNKEYAGLYDPQRNPLPLQHQTVEAVIEGPRAGLVLTQRYRNQELGAIEAVYHFPLPLDATLLGVEIELNDRRLQGQVAARKAAQATYEDAVGQGDTAILLEASAPGLYTMNLGNLLPGDRVSIRLRLSWPLHWQGEELRFALPTTLAPRYGNPADAGLEPHQVPVSNAWVEHHYELAVNLRGPLAAASVRSPTHRIVQSRGAGTSVRISLEQGVALADRDLVLLIAAQPAERSQVRLLMRADGSAVLDASLRIPPRDSEQPLAIKLLVDCSGSMAGDSIAEAREAMIRAIGALRDGDEFSISAFGNQTRHWQPRMVAMGERRTEARRWISQLDADMGGTGMHAALRAVFDLPGTRSADVLLITDGQVHGLNAIALAARESRHRVFIVAVGTSPAEDVLRPLGESSGGAIVFVTPHEDIAGAIDRQVQRMRQVMVESVQVNWPGRVQWESPRQLERRVFSGDTVQLHAGLETIGAPALSLSLRYADGVSEQLSLSLEPCPASTPEHEDLVRIAAAARLRDAANFRYRIDEALLTRIAVEHQLLSPWSSYVVTEMREAGATAIPELRVVPNMQPAGFRGAGSVVVAQSSRPSSGIRSGKLMPSEETVRFSMTPPRASEPYGARPRKLVRGPAADLPRDRTIPPHPDPSTSIGEDQAVKSYSMSNKGAGDPGPAPWAGVATRLVSLPAPADWPDGIGFDWLAGLPLSAEMLATLRALVELGWSEQDVVLAFLTAGLVAGATAGGDPVLSDALDAWRQRHALPLVLIEFFGHALGGACFDQDRWSPGSLPAPPQRVRRFIAAGVGPTSAGR